MPRAMWKAVIRLGDESVAVKLYSAANRRSIGFRMLHRDDGMPVRQRMIDPRTGEEVPFEDIRRGYEVERGQFVVLTDDELEELEPEKSRDIDASRLVPAEAIDPRWYDRPYFLGPDGNPAEYAALVQALAAEERHAIVHWAMRNKAYVGALRSDGERLHLTTLRHAEEVIATSELGDIPEPRLSKGEIKLAEQLISALEDEFDPEAYTDEYKERVMELIEAKREGKTIRMPRAKKREEAPASLSDALRASLGQAREKRSA